MESTSLRCNVGPGQFTGEYAVSAAQSNGSPFSLFVDEDFVDREDGTGNGWLCVDIVSRRGDDALIKLPAQSLEGGQFVTVKSEQLRPSLRMDAMPISFGDLAAQEAR
jgi:hypothetical protein